MSLLTYLKNCPARTRLRRLWRPRTVRVTTILTLIWAGAILATVTGQWPWYLVGVAAAAAAVYTSDWSS